jgi:hypothetical protein
MLNVTAQLADADSPLTCAKKRCLYNVLRTTHRSYNADCARHRSDFVVASLSSGNPEFAPLVANIISRTVTTKLLFLHGLNDAGEELPAAESMRSMRNAWTFGRTLHRCAVTHREKKGESVRFF